MNYHDLYLLNKVISCGSFSTAAQQLGMPTSTLSRRVQALEVNVGTRLLSRTAKHVHPTETGKLLYQRSHALYAELETLSSVITEEINSPSGVLNVTAPIGLSTQVLDSYFFAFMDAYPNIQLNLKLVNRQVNLKQENIDVAFRIGNQNVQDWVTRKLFDSTYSLVAESEWLGRQPSIEHPDQLRQLPLLAAPSLSVWHFTHSAESDYILEVEGRMIVDEMSTLMSAVERGMGISLLPDYMLPSAKTKLQSVLPQWLIPTRQVQMLYADRQYIPAKVRVFIDFIIQQAQQMLND